MTAETTSPPDAKANADVPLYTHADAAGYLQLPLSCVYVLPGRRGNGSHPGPAPEARLSFQQLADLFVLAGGVNLLGNAAGPTQNIGRGWEMLEAALRSAPPERDSNGTDLDGFAARFGLKGEGAATLLQALAHRLDRVERDDGKPVRLFPFTRDPAENSPRIVVLDPRVRFGRPTLVGRGVATDILFERHQAGDSVADLAEDYDVTAAEVEEAIRYEGRAQHLLFPLLGS